MRIALVTPYDLASAGGVNTHTLALAAWLREAGHDARVVGPASKRCEATRAGHVQVMGRPLLVSAGGTRAHLTLDPRLPAALGVLLHEAKVDLVHVQEPFLPFLGWAALRAARCPVVATYHSSERGTAAFYRAAGRLLRSGDRRFAARVVVSPVAAATAKPVLARSPLEIPPCAALEAFVAGEGDAPERDERPVILYVGRDEPRKGLSVLLRGFAYLRQRLPAQLWVAGGTRRATRQLAGRLGLTATDVRFLGALPDNALPALYRAADIFCSPALNGESVGLVLLEAMAAGTPVVASDIAGYRFAAQEGQDAVLVPPGDPRALAETLERVICTPGLRDRLIGCGRERARAFSVEAVGLSHLALYDDARRHGAAGARPR